MAAEGGFHDCLRLLLDAGANCNVPTKHARFTPSYAHQNPGTVFIVDDVTLQQISPIIHHFIKEFPKVQTITNLYEF